MQKPIENPQVPYVGPIPGGIHPGKMVRIQGVAAPNGDRFDINIQCGPNRDDIGLHISVRLNQGYIARNSYQQMSGWGEEQGDGPLLIGHGQQFEVLILSDLHDYKIAVNGQHFCMFPYRVPKEHLSHLLINGDVLITLISWEGNVPLQQSGGPPPMGSPSAPPMMPPVSKGPPGYGVPTPPGINPSLYGSGQPYAPQPTRMPMPPPYPTQASGASYYPVTPQPQGPYGQYNPTFNQNGSNKINTGYASGYPYGTGLAAGASALAAGAANFIKHPKLKKSKLKKAMKYGVPLAGAGIGTYLVSSALHKVAKPFKFKSGWGSSCSSSSSDSD